MELFLHSNGWVILNMSQYRPLYMMALLGQYWPLYRVAPLRHNNSDSWLLSFNISSITKESSSVINNWTNLVDPVNHCFDSSICFGEIFQKNCKMFDAGRSWRSWRFWYKIRTWPTWSLDPRDTRDTMTLWRLWVPFLTTVCSGALESMFVIWPLVAPLSHFL